MIAVIYFIFSLFSLFILFRNWQKDTPKRFKLKERRISQKTITAKRTVEIWGKAAVGLYLWQHIFEARLDNINGELEKYGEIQFDKIIIKFRTGMLITPESIDRDTKNAILVINGREPNKIKFARKWLDSLTAINSLENFGVLLLGNEQCDNDWLMPYMINRGGIIKFAFIIYDIPYADGKLFHSWPLGVATYRNFPVTHNNAITTEKRKYLCNFIGTIYKSSSREELMKIINANEDMKNSCFLHVRNDWVPHETKESSEIFYNALKNSELTLCPVGKNTECYRIYEAISLGSVPVVEDVMTPGRCGKSVAENSKQIPLRILKKFNAPVIYVKDWKELPQIITKEKMLSEQFVLKRRQNLLMWYQKFKYELRNMFLKQLKTGFNF